MSGRLSRDTIKKLAHQWLDEALEEERGYRLSRKWDLEELDKRNEQMSMLETDALEDLECCNFKRVEKRADSLLKTEQVEFSKDSREYKEFCAALLEVEARFLGAIRKTGFMQILKEDNTPAQTPQVEQQAPSLTIEEAIEKYIQFKTEGPNPWGASSRKDIPPQLRQFADMIHLKHGKIHINQLTRDHMQSYWKNLQKLPGTRTKRYKGKSLAQLLKMKVPEQDLYKPKTLQTRFNAVRTFLNWAELEGMVEKVSRLNKVLEVPKSKTKTKSQRRSFTEKELKQLFSPEAYSKRYMRKDWHYWTPLLALFSGARIEEICQLRLSDIRKDSGVWYFDINDEGEGKNVKTEAGKRVVPLHPYLINELGFLEFLGKLKKRGYKKLFPDLSPDVKGKYSHAVSKWFTRFRRKQNVGAQEGVSDVTFHSFRHTFITRAKLLDLPRYKVKEVVGHEQGEFSDVTANYEGNYPVDTLLNDVVAKIDFHEMLDLSHLLKK
ncbi:site-specific integrase [Maridesulfovibrio sp.]|uniref:site-specific integrase n=1 Tax=Maridesulfovibrio sp. TaxID=2795000 RepID=UPI0029CA3070|nr:site-specific integrase [Maridesulfovibrio sp.]